MTTENNTANGHSTATKILAIVGFVALVIVALWATMQIVRFVPGFFASLASIADQTRGPVKSLELLSSESIVNSGEAFTLEVRHDRRKEGSYDFSWRCTEGVYVVLAEDETNNSISCDETYTLSEEAIDTIAFNVTIDSEKQRFVDVPLSVAFTDEDEEETETAKALITVVNADIVTNRISIEGGEEGSEEEEGSSEEETETNTNTNTNNVPLTPGTPILTGYETRTVTKTVPGGVSLPDGTADLQIEILSVGNIDSDGDYVKSSSNEIERRKYPRGAVEFEVKNIGTKTSDTWKFQTTVPTTPAKTYESPTQTGLKPGERSVVTIDFTKLKTGDQTIAIEIITDEDNDLEDNNNRDEIDIDIVTS